MRLFKATYRDRKGRKRQSAKWYVEFKDHLDTVRRLPAFTDRKASDEFGRKLERLTASVMSGMMPDRELIAWLEAIPSGTRDKLVSIGMLNRKRAAAGRKLEEHVKDFEASLQAKAGTDKHVKMTASRVRAVIEGCGFRYWSDISASKVQVHLGQLRQGKNGLSIQSSNYYLQSFKQFCRWMVREGRTSESPVAHLRALNARTDLRRVRRALMVGEARRLLEAARQGGAIYGMRGPDRAMLYRIALETGFRWSELRSLRRSSFDLEGVPPTVTVEAAYSKHRRDDTLPLRCNTAETLGDYLADRLPVAKAFPMPTGNKGAAMLRADLEAAEVAEKDEAGRVVDFHSLRHTFITNLCNGGVHPKTAQALARHSTIGLTMDRYTHLVAASQTNAVAVLPDLDAPDASEAMATGTDGEPVLAECLLSKHGQDDTACDGLRRAHDAESQGAKSSKSLSGLEKHGVSDTMMRHAGEWRNGRRIGLKIRFPQRGSGGSNPPSPTGSIGSPPIAGVRSLCKAGFGRSGMSRVCPGRVVLPGLGYLERERTRRDVWPRRSPLAMLRTLRPHRRRGESEKKPLEPCLTASFRCARFAADSETWSTLLNRELIESDLMVLPADRKLDSTLRSLTGQTASGKSAIGIWLARTVGAEIISVDSIKVYRGFDIGTAKPSRAVRGDVPFHVVDVVRPADNYTLAQYLKAAHDAASEIAAQGRCALFVGGTPLYLRGLLYGIFDGPGADWQFRAELEQRARQEGSEAIFEELRKADPSTAERLHPHDLKRVIRALEVARAAGRPISELQKQFPAPAPPVAYLMVALRRSEADLRERIHRRADQMFADGLVDEVRSLAHGKLNRSVRKAIGYREVLAHLRGEMSLSETVESVKRNTWRMARKQMTWLRSFPDVQWLDVGPDEPLEETAERTRRLLFGPGSMN